VPETKEKRNYFVHKEYKTGAERKKTVFTPEQLEAAKKRLLELGCPASRAVVLAKVADDKRLFLEVYYECETLEEACAAVGKKKATICNWIEHDAVFAQDYMRKRGVMRLVTSDGVEANIRDIATGEVSKNDPLRKITMPEAVSAMFLLKSYEPDTFRENVKKKGGIVKIRTAKVVRTLEDGAQKEETLEVRQYSDEDDAQQGLLTNGDGNTQEES
jgi:hypothetical protein